MKAFLLTVITTSLYLVSGQATAGEQLALKSGCMACHAVNSKVYGPSFKEIALKYKGDKSVQATLVSRVQNGSTGIWGAFKMTPMGKVKEEDIKTIVKWILSL